MNSNAVFVLAIAIAACHLSASEARLANVNLSFSMTVADDSHRLSEDMIRICAKETEISMDELQKLRQLNGNGNATETTQCFVHCIFEQLGLVHDGVFVDKDFLGTLTDATNPDFHMSGAKCHAIRGDNKCETAYKIFRCQQEVKQGQRLALAKKAGEGTDAKPAAPLADLKKDI